VVEDAGEARTTGVHPHGGVGAEQVLVQGPDHRLGHRGAAQLLVDADLVQPASMTARTDCLNESGSATECVWGSNTGGLRSASTNDSATGPSASRLISVNISRAVSASKVGVFAFTECFVDAQHLEQIEYLVADVALIVAHWFLLDENATCGWVLGLSYPPVTRLNYTRR